MIAVISRSSGVASEAAAGGLRLAFGIGAYLIPLGLLLWGISFFVRADIRESRTGIGIALILLSVVSLAALAPSGAVSLSEAAVSTQGGYLGGGFAWLLAKLTGQVIAGVLLVGLFVGGLVVIGLSISGLYEASRDRFAPAEKEPVPRRERQPRTAVRRRDDWWGGDPGPRAFRPGLQAVGAR